MNLVDNKNKTLLFCFLLIFLGCLLRIVYALHTPIHTLADDGFITLRYAKNFLLGNGFVYNEGERVLGTTTPLFALFAIVPGVLAGVESLPLISLILSAFFSILSIIVFHDLLSKTIEESHFRVAALCSFCVGPSLVASAITGMETSAVICFMIVSLWLAVRRQFFACAVACGFLVILRPDCLIWSAVLFLCICVSERRFLYQELIIGLIPVVPWVLFAFLYFGSPLPNTIAAKAAAVPANVDTLSYIFSAARSYHLDFSLDSPRIFISCLIIVSALLGSSLLWLRYSALRPLLIWFVLYVAAFIIKRAPFFDWYYVPPRFVLYLLCALGVITLVPRILKAVIPVACCVVSALLGIYLLIKVDYNAHAKDNFENAVSPCVVQWINANASENDKIYLEHIGYIGFYVDNYIYDNKGLVSPLLLDSIIKGGDRLHLDLLLKYRPEIAVLWPSEIPEHLKEELSEIYQLRKTCSDGQNVNFIYTKKI